MVGGLKSLVERPHSSLFRAEINFDYQSDNAFKIDVKKSKIELDPSLVDWLRDELRASKKAAEDEYRQTSKAKASSTKVSHVAATTSIDQAKNVKTVRVDQVDPDKLEADITNSRGQKLTIKSPVENDVNGSVLR